jgi:hypothetical protein
MPVAEASNCQVQCIQREEYPASIGLVDSAVTFTGMRTQTSP